MATTQNLKAVVTLGGAVDPSLKSLTGSVQKSFGKTTKSVKAMEREQQKLTREIQKSRKAGASVKLLTDRYDALNDELGRARKKADALGTLNKVGGSLKRMGGYAAATTGAVMGLSGAVAGLMTMTNQQTAEQLGLAKSYGMTIEQFQAWGGIAEQAGLNAENTGDLVEELTNKIGEFKTLGEQSAVADVFGALGLDAAMLEGMNAAEQFEFIMRRLEGVGDAQAAASLADMLMGGEGNKVVTYLRQSGKSIDDLLESQKRFNQLTSRGAEGAGAYGKSVKQLFGTVKSAWAEISGVVGGELAPSISAVAEEVAEFARNNKGELVQSLKSAVNVGRELAVGLWSVGSTIAGVVGSVGDMVGGMDNLVQIGAVVMAGVVGAKMIGGLISTASAVGGLISAAGGLSAVLPGVATGIKAIGLAVMANPIGLVIGGLIAAGTALVMNWDSVKNWFGGFWEGLKGTFSSAVDGIKTVLGWTPIGAVIKNWEPIKNFFGNMWDNITAIFHKKVAQVKGMIDKVSGWVQKLKFWDDDEAEVSLSEGKQAAALASASHAQQVINQAAPAGRGNTVHQRVEKIEVVAAPGQSPQEVGAAVNEALGGYQSDGLYDYAMG